MHNIDIIDGVIQPIRCITATFDYLRSESLSKFWTKILSNPELHATVLITSASSLGVWSDIFTELCCKLMVCLNNLNRKIILYSFQATIKFFIVHGEMLHTGSWSEICDPNHSYIRVILWWNNWIVILQVCIRINIPGQISYRLEILQGSIVHRWNKLGCLCCQGLELQGFY